MESTISPFVLKLILKKHNFFFKKALGQNFLVDANIIKKIVETAGLTNRDIIIEVGPGAGILTKSMAELARAVVAIEIDNKLLPVLSEIIGGHNNVCIINDDALKVNFDAVSKKLNEAGLLKKTNRYKVIANIPYYITSPLLVHFLTWGVQIDSMVVMVQKEVAERLVAGPGSKKYGSLSVLVQYYSVPVLVHRVPRNVFIPPPDVDSAIVKLTICKKPRVKVNNEDDFFGVVRAAFNKRRKTLLNALLGAGPGSKISGVTREVWISVLKEAGIDPKRRGETLSLEEFASISNLIAKYEVEDV